MNDATTMELSGRRTKRPDKLEHRVLSRLEPDPDPINDSSALVSIAISLKRIADALEGNLGSTIADGVRSALVRDRMEQR